VEEALSPATGWAVVLGASAGTGAAVARAVSRDPGLDVFGVHRGRHPEEARALEAEIQAHGRRVVMLVADAGSAEAAANGAEALLAAAGPRSVRLFVHSLASASLGRLAAGGDKRLSLRQIQKTFDVMAHSFVYWTQELLARDLLAPSARLLGLGNTLAESLILNCGLIAAAKAALEAYVRSLALELGPEGHRVNLLKFPTVNTHAVRKVYGEEAMAHVERVHRQMIPAGRMCTVEEVARVVAFLASDAGEWFNGATIDYTGGMTIGLADILLRDAGSPDPEGVGR
jgi:NAD(P)-dependent dehydrogenase (short-subunit alcohol dehydrogenase family)